MDYSATVAYTYLVHLKMDATLDLCFVLVKNKLVHAIWISRLRNVQTINKTFRF